jgi:dynein light chain Tctex-type 1
VNSEHEGGQTGADTMIGRRGMHSATGAFWNNEKDGMWSFKYEGGEGKGFDVVVSVVWIGIV